MQIKEERMRQMFVQKVVTAVVDLSLVRTHISIYMQVLLKVGGTASWLTPHITVHARSHVTMPGRTIHTLSQGHGRRGQGHD